VQSSSTSIWVYNTANQVAGVIAPGATSASPSPYTYDLSGDVTADTTTGNQYLFDAEGRICAVQSPIATGGWIMTGYVYDAEGTRIAKGTITAWNCDPSANGLTDETDYILGPGGEQVTEVSPDADGNMQVQRTYVYAAGATIATYDPVANPAYDSSNPTAAPQTLYMPSFRLTDWLGTLRVTTDAYGVAQGTCASLPYGDATACSGNIPDNHHFTGKERDTESGNDYFGARYYASTMGRWLSPDWSAKVEPVPYAKLDDPQSLNLYAYLMNSPLDGVDEDGHGPRQNAVRKAWRQERALVRATGKGTRGWDALQKAELTKPGPNPHVSGFQGHHINSVAANQQLNPALEGDPNNIAFKTEAEHFAEHKFNWANATKGALLSRVFSIAPALPYLAMFTGAARDVGETGMWTNPMNNMKMIGDVGRAASFMENQGTAGGWGDGAYTFYNVSGFWQEASSSGTYSLHDGAFWNGDKKVDSKAIEGKAVQKTPII
jgi:RHS repeat-associated protein